MNTCLSHISSAPASSLYSARRTRHRVDSFCDALKAKRVRLVGDFTRWEFAANPMNRIPDGRWMASPISIPKQALSHTTTVMRQSR
jgi:hypothetical protein